MGEIVKVAFVGTSCIGKSSLLSICDERIGEKILPVSEAAREYFVAHPDVTDRFSFAAQSEVQVLAFQKEKAAHKQASYLGKTAIVCDRSVLDAPVIVNSQGDTDGALILMERATSWLPTYDKIYLLDPADVPFAADNVRDEDEATRQLFHDTFLGFFAAHNIAYTLLSGDKEERFGQISSFILESQT
jgi:nicotinamide riboside kinase